MKKIHKVQSNYALEYFVVSKYDDRGNVDKRSIKTSILSNIESHHYFIIRCPLFRLMTTGRTGSVSTSNPWHAGRYDVIEGNVNPRSLSPRQRIYSRAGREGFAYCILMNSPSHLVFQRCESLRQKGGAGSRGGRRGRRWRRRRRGQRRWGGPEPEMAARWLLLALLAAHAAALPDIIRIGEYLSSLPSRVKRLYLSRPFSLCSRLFFFFVLSFSLSVFYPAFLVRFIFADHFTPGPRGKWHHSDEIVIDTSLYRKRRNFGSPTRI